MLNLFKQNRLLQALLFSSFCSVLLVAFRVFWSGKITFIFLPGNLILAWIPLGLSLLLPKEKATFSMKVIALLCGWLLFFPNAPYVITDLEHLRPRHYIPFWFDILLLTSFAWNGLVLGFVSLLEIQKFLLRKFTPKFCWTLIACTLMLSSFGIYLGRFQRWNSWDILLQPVSLLSDILQKFLHPFAEPRVIGVTAGFSLFLFAGYLTFYFLARPVNR